MNALSEDFHLLMFYPGWIEFTLAVLLDLLIGDPRWMPHPVRGLGRLISWQENLLFRLFPHAGYRIAGVILVSLTVLVSVSSSVALLVFSTGLFRSFVIIYLIYSLLALTSLNREAKRVVRHLRLKDFGSARGVLSRIVGRDTANLSESEMMRAVTETVAENLSDGVIAPTFYLLLGGIPGMVAYKCINTLDSMVGYKNERYEKFGWAAARLDDLVNYLPARLSALLVLFSASLFRLSVREGWRVVLRDAPLQPSPNAGYPEAAMAGVLRVRLGGRNQYFGQPAEKPFMGEPVHELCAETYPNVRRLLYSSALFFYLIAGTAFYSLERYA